MKLKRVGGGLSQRAEHAARAARRPSAGGARRLVPPASVSLVTARRRGSEPCRAELGDGGRLGGGGGAGSGKWQVAVAGRRRQIGVCAGSRSYLCIVPVEPAWECRSILARYHIITAPHACSQHSLRLAFMRSTHEQRSVAFSRSAERCWKRCWGGGARAAVARATRTRTIKISLSYNNNEHRTHYMS